MVKTGDAPVIQLTLTEEEFRILVFATASFHDLTINAPLIASSGVSRSDAMRRRRAAQRFHDRIKSLAQGYGIAL